MKKECIKVSIITLIGNIVLSIFKLISGIVGNSNAMISDSIHSLSDVVSTIIVIMGINLSNKKSDKKREHCGMTPERIQKLEKIGVIWDAAEWKNERRRGGGGDV